MMVLDFYELTYALWNMFALLDFQTHILYSFMKDFELYN